VGRDAGSLGQGRQEESPSNRRHLERVQDRASLRLEGRPKSHSPIALIPFLGGNMKALRNLGILVALSAMSALPASASATGHFEGTLQVSGPVDLDVVSSSGNITVHTGTGNSVSVSAKIRAQNSWLFGGDEEAKVRRIEQNPPIEQQGNTIRIG